MDEMESQEIVVDFGKICRLCLSGDGVLISLFPTDSVIEGKSIPDRIMALMKIKVVKNDGFPSWICHNCLSQVDKCYEFFEMCRNSQTALNESFLTALSEVGINVVPVKDSEESDELVVTKSENEKMTVYYTKKEEIKAEVESEPEEATEGKQFCSECSEVFLNKDELFIHRMSFHRGNVVTESLKEDEESDKTDLWTCDPCGAKFHSKNAIITHIRCKHLKTDKDPNFQIKKLIFCKYCGLFFGKKNIMRHLELVHRMSKNMESDQKGSFDCRICFRPFMRHSSLRNHIEKLHGDNLEVIAEAENCEIVWNCHECDSVFLEEIYLMQHYGSNHSKYPLEVNTLRGLKNKDLICTCGAISSNSFEASLHGIFYHFVEKPDETKVECPACDRMFWQIEELKVHLISYHCFMSMSLKNECVFCNDALDSKDSLRIHLNKNHGITFEKNPHDDKLYAKCKDEDLSELSEEERMEGVEEKEVLVAIKEKDALVSEEEKEVLVAVKEKVLVAAAAEEEEEKVLVAVEEKEALLTEEEREVLEAEEDKSLFICDTCGEFFKNEEELQNHCLQKDCHSSHICRLCSKGYKTANHLKRHVTEYHNTMSPIKCPLCPKVFPRKMNLHNHYKRRHLKQTKNFVCSYCGQSLKGKVALKSHEDRLHRNIRSYKCSQCPEAFTTRSILQKHAQRHLSERPMLNCQYCEKKFSTISGIERHIKTHEGVKEFTCDLAMCGKSFYTKSELKRHIKFHTRDFRHVCSVCDHKFMSPGELKKHSTKHTGERPFKCHLCSCAYARRDDKVKHLKRVHSLKVKRIYGKPLRKYSDDNEALVDTIVIDESSEVNVPENSEVEYSNMSPATVMP